MSAAGRRHPEFSQHFLRSRALASQLIDLAHIAPTDLVLEVGPGTGMLTEHLVARAAAVRAIEIDPALAGALRARYGSALDLVEGNFLNETIPAEARVVANLPFNITAAAVRRITASDARDAHLILQREAAIRFAGHPWGGETLPSLLLKPWWHIEILRALRASDFVPPPEVDAAVIWLARRAPALVHRDDAEAYRQFIGGSLGAGRTIGQVLRRWFSSEQVRRLSQDLRFSTDAAPSDLAFEQWLALFRATRVLPASPARPRDM